MASGKYDKRISVIGTTFDESAEDAFGAGGTSKAPPFKLWAEVAYGSGGERRVGAAQEQANLPVTVIVRKSSLSAPITPGSHSLQFDALEWDIESVAPDAGRPKDLIIIARARV